MKIRKYIPEDAGEILSLFHGTVHFINSRDYTQQQIDAWAPNQNVNIEDWNEKLLKGKTLVAEIKGRVVGFGSLVHHSTSIGMLYVHKDFQRKGIAKALLKKLEKKLIKREVPVAKVEASITARSFFEKRGYHLVEETRKMFNDTEFLNYHMEKKLKSRSGKHNQQESKPFLWRDLFVNKIVDLLIVISGVTIAFQLNNWKLNSDQKSLESFYVESIVTDLQKDIEEEKEILRDLESDRRLTRSFLKNENPNPDSLANIIVEVLSLETFTGHQNTYQTLLQGNGLTVISDKNLRGEITEYYTSYTSIRRFESVYTDALFKLFEYFSPYCNLEKRKLVDESVLKNTRTRNLLLIALTQLNDGIEAHSEALQKAKSLKANL